MDGTEENYQARERFFRMPLHEVPPAHFWRWQACLRAVQRIRENPEGDTEEASEE